MKLTSLITLVLCTLCFSFVYAQEPIEYESVEKVDNHFRVKLNLLKVRDNRDLATIKTKLENNKDVKLVETYRNEDITTIIILFHQVIPASQIRASINQLGFEISSESLIINDVKIYKQIMTVEKG